ncbi:pyridoxal phosphate-dependent decarboxylase family protein [Planctomicrobium sp. SH664]|uniref:pyridoxal phosphate-dependent decarboxylase family protein n=1 Tax=Planctomicrobium sp. SH664 TaxID=3448125 RepID=UPI003F5C4559
MKISRESLELLGNALSRLQEGFEHLPPTGVERQPDLIRPVLEAVAVRLQENFPYHHPLYAGAMMKPPAEIAQLAYFLAMCLNPNNHSIDGGRVSTAMEKECIRQLGAMFGWPDPLGHLCSGGTMANFEALWIARERTLGKRIVASAQAHYTHSRLSQVLNVPFSKVESDSAGRMSLSHLEQVLQGGDVGTVVATLGTTGLGAVDPLAELVELRERYGFRLHVDTAYGGYFTLARNLGTAARRAFDALPLADSIVVDPHKHGLQPYGCGCVLFRDREVATVYRHDSPYTYFTSEDLHLGEISLECSRDGAAAVALWATIQFQPLIRGGDFARGLERGRQAALLLKNWIDRQPGLCAVTDPELDIVVWFVRSERATDASAASRRIFAAAAEQNLHLSLLKLPQSCLESLQAIAEWDEPEVTCLRSTLMKPEHLEWLPDMIHILERVHV